MDNKYKDLIFTKHALERMKKRSITQHSVWQILQHPDSTRPEEKPNTSRFIRQLGGRNYHIIGTYLPEEKKTLIISAWVRGEDDEPPLSWQIITLPFRLVWKLLKMISKFKQK